MPSRMERSLSDMHDDSTRDTFQNQTRRFHVKEDIYAMTVLQFASDCTEDDVDQQFLRIAMELGIDVPVSPQTTLDLVARNVSALNLTSDPDRTTPTSRISQSYQSTSDSCSEQRSPTNASSLANDPITSPPSSIASTSSRRSSYISLKSSFRKISALRRRRTIDVPLPPLTLTGLTRKPSMPGQQRGMPAEGCSTGTATARCQSIPTQMDGVLLEGIPWPAHDLGSSPSPRPNLIDSLPSPGHNLIESLPSPTGNSIDGIPSLFPDLIEWDLESRRRSLKNAQLKLLRIYQIEERDRFSRFEASQHRLMRLGQIQAKQALLERYRDHQQRMESRHADALASLEHNHLSAEVDLHRTLTLERQGCETRLRHMQAYCNPGFSIEGMPARTVTKKDRRQLEQQHHVCNGMDNLHASRINVLREKQAKQLERIAAKQEAELETLGDDLRRETQDLDAACEAEAMQLHRDFSERKDRLVARWTLAEAIERRRMENITGDRYAPLPAIRWEKRCPTGDGDEEADLARLS